MGRIWDHPTHQQVAKDTARTMASHLLECKMETSVFVEMSFLAMNTWQMMNLSADLHVREMLVSNVEDIGG